MIMGLSMRGTPLGSAITSRNDSGRLTLHQYRNRRTQLVRTVILTTVMAIVGVLFTAGTAVADGEPECLRAGEPAGPCVQETSFPDDFPSAPLRGMILLVEGGAWQSAQPYLVPDGNIYREASNRWLARGYAVAMIEHSDGSGVFPDTPTGSQAFDNVLQWYDTYRTFWDELEGYGPDFPICASGFSSGGHFALLLGANRPSLDCIVAEAPPSKIDYRARADGSPSHAPGIAQDIQYIADRTFSGVEGVSPDPIWSPLNVRSQITMPVLIGHAKNDPVVRYGQTRYFCDETVGFNCQAFFLRGSREGEIDFSHANVNDSDLARFRLAEEEFVCAVVAPFTGPCG